MPDATSLTAGARVICIRGDEERGDVVLEVDLYVLWAGSQPSRYRGPMRGVEVAVARDLVPRSLSTGADVYFRAARADRTWRVTELRALHA